jgi:hypothetical protein
MRRLIPAATRMAVTFNIQRSTLNGMIEPQRREGAKEET